MARLYIIEDDASLRAELGKLLDLEGFEWRACEDFARAAELACAWNPDCVLLDAMLPGTDGRIVARRIRERSRVPIIMLTCLDSDFDEVMAMDQGVDDYLTKPYRPAVLLAHVKAALRRTSAEVPQSSVEHAGVRLDLASGKVEYRGRTAELTRNEARVLALLMRDPAATVSRQEIMCDLWESDAFVDDNTLTVNVNRLRKALLEIGVGEDYIRTRRGIGYSL